MTQRLLITVTGIVQGVGFRPFVYGLARRHRLAGGVKNRAGAVVIDVQGAPPALSEFVAAIQSQAPPLARIEGVKLERVTPGAARRFEIEKSADGAADELFVAPDVATCEDCLRELADPADRRHGYAFLNCVNCGPRLTIIEALPYDRERTSMKGFGLCPECRREYDDPADRRHHAQPVACAACGPRLLALDASGARLEERDPVARAARELERGGIVAVKGLGGYHLACDATNGAAVARLRRLKRRAHRPFALMARDLEAARALCELDAFEEETLASRPRPIVLLRKRKDCAACSEVAPGSPRLGLMLPYTPLHHLLMRALKGPAVVMTSANDSDQPMLIDDREAVERLRERVDLFLAHDREIRGRCDDSVVWVEPGSGRQPGVARFIRRSRGYAPEPLRLPLGAGMPVLACGAQQKNTFALGRGRSATLSAHIGDLGEGTAFRAFREEIARFEELFRFSPRVLAHDLHPDYLCTRYALERARREGLLLVPVQHHHAHMASAMAEHGLTETVIGVTFDGTGFGADGRVWGGEFLVGDLAGFERAAHLKYVPMPSGELAIREPWRMALGHLLAAGIDPEVLRGRSSCINERATGLFEKMISQGINCPLTSSMGRLFDAVAAALGLREQVSYEGQAAVELEALARSGEAGRRASRSYAFELARPEKGGAYQIDPAPVWKAVVADIHAGVSGPDIALRFHRAVAQLIGEACERIARSRRLTRVVLSGGVFMNAWLSVEAARELRARGLEVFSQRRVPCNDGGLSLGQLAVAAARLERGELQ